jgi:myosin heavy subunit
MQQILKRLELIKTSIAIEDEEIIKIQITKLASLAIDDAVQAILSHLGQNDYASASLAIDEYLSQYSGVALYQDGELSGLKMELKVLEGKLQELSEEKSEYLNELSEFNTQYSLHLGEVIRSILELKKELLYKKTLFKRKAFDEKQEQYDHANQEIDELKETLAALKDELDAMDALDDAYEEIAEQFKRAKEAYKNKVDERNDIQKEREELEEELQEDPSQQEYEEAKSQYEEFHNEYEEIRTQERYELDADELTELKKAYRKASKLCHPDLVPDELQEQALKLMQELNEAYAKKDLKKVHQILSMLENGGGFDIASEAINNKELLRIKIEELRIKIDEVADEIEEIKTDETFTTIQELDDWDEYFEKVKEELDEEKERLKQQVYSLSSEANNSGLEKLNTHHDAVQEDYYWNEKF